LEFNRSPTTFMLYLPKLKHNLIFRTGSVSDDGNYLIVTVWTIGDFDTISIYIADLKKINYQIKGKLELIPVVKKMKNNYEVCNLLTNGTYSVCIIC
jgi:hypothetical protein